VIANAVFTLTYTFGVLLLATARLIGKIVLTDIEVLISSLRNNYRLLLRIWSLWLLFAIESRRVLEAVAATIPLRITVSAAVVPLRILIVIARVSGLLCRRWEEVEANTRPGPEIDMAPSED
jgi:hypothetical protein